MKNKRQLINQSIWNEENITSSILEKEQITKDCYNIYIKCIYPGTPKVKNIREAISKIKVLRNKETNLFQVKSFDINLDNGDTLTVNINLSDEKFYRLRSKMMDESELIDGYAKLLKAKMLYTLTNFFGKKDSSTRYPINEYKPEPLNQNTTTLFIVIGFILLLLIASSLREKSSEEKIFEAIDRVEKTHR